MDTELAATPLAVLTLEGLEAQAAEYQAASIAPDTRRVYTSALRKYDAWCKSNGLNPLGGEAGPVRLYMAHLGVQRRAVATIRVALAAIAAAYRLAGHPFDPKIPALAGVVEGITRTRGAAPERQARPATLEILQAMLAACGPYQGKRAALAARNRAMLLLGFGAALRRQELVGLNLADVELVEGRGIMVTLRRSKTDQHGEGQGIAVPANEGEPDLCPARALKSWLVHRLTAGDIDGDAKDRPLFCAVTRFGKVTGLRLSDKAVVRLVKAMAESVGQDAARFSGHSLRAGFITEADAQEAGLSSIMRQARHKKAETTLRYTRPAELWRNNAGTAIFGRKKKPMSDSQATENVVRLFLRLIAERYDIEGAILYGSRARGTHRRDSDADVAVLLRGEHQRFLTTKLDMADIAFDVMLETGVLVSPLPIWLDEWEHPESYSNPALLHNINREGVRL